MIPFPDGSTRTPTAVRATHRLEYGGNAHAWQNDHFHARASTSQRGPSLVIETPDQRRILAVLDHMGDGQGYAGGAWIAGIATAFTARKTGAAVVLEIWDVEDAAPGPWHVQGVDG